VVWSSIPFRAWRDTAASAAVVALGLAAVAPGFPAGDPHTATAAVLAVAACALAWTYRWVPLIWLGSALLLAANLHALLVTFQQAVVPITFAGGLLAHATVVLTVAVGVHRLAPGLRYLLAEPLRQSGLIATALVVPLLPFTLAPEGMGDAALHAGWLAALWLILAWAECRPALFSLGQVVAGAAVLLGVTWWLEGQSWVAGGTAGLIDPRSLQAYGIVLAAFSLFWMSLRSFLRRDETALALLNPPWTAVDRVVLGTVVLGQLALAVMGALPGTAAELTPLGQIAAAEWPAALAHAYGLGAWGCCSP
jgi:hypothetical protein